MEWHAGIKQMTVLGRSGRFNAASDMAHALRDGWAASVAVSACDVAFAEDTNAAFSRSGSHGQLRDWLSPCSPPNAPLQ